MISSRQLKNWTKNSKNLWSEFCDFLKMGSITMTVIVHLGQLQFRHEGKSLFSLKTAWKWRKLDSEGERVPGTPLDLPMLHAQMQTGVTEYSDPPENPGTGPDFTENMGSYINVLPLTQGTEACLSSGLSLTLGSSNNRAICPSTFSP